MDERDGISDIVPMELESGLELVHRLGGIIDHGQPAVPDLIFREDCFFFWSVLLRTEADDAIYPLASDELDGGFGQVLRLVLPGVVRGRGTEDFTAREIVKGDFFPILPFGGHVGSSLGRS